ncbi:MAG: zf-HC2 domain-containing protein [Acidimicrobiales bacterium]
MGGVMVRLLSAWRRDLVCRDAVALMTDYLEGVMPARQRTRLERHLAACDGCDEYLRQMRATIDLLGRVDPGDLAPETRTGLVELLLAYRDEVVGDAGDDDDGHWDGADGKDGNS